MKTLEKVFLGALLTGVAVFAGSYVVKDKKLRDLGSNLMVAGAFGISCYYSGRRDGKREKELKEVRYKSDYNEL